MASADGQTFQMHEPATGELLAEVARAGVEDANRAVAATRAAFDDGPWRRWHASEHGRALQLYTEVKNVFVEID